MRKRAVNFVKSSALQFTLRRMHEAFTTLKVLGGLAIAAILLGDSRPFQTFETFPFPARQAYWLTICTLSFATGFFVSTIAEQALTLRLSEWPRFLASSLAAATAVVATLKGTQLVLIRLPDAIAKAGEGLQTHRSHRVSFKAIAKVERTNGKITTTANGATLPVSRSGLPAVKAAGLLT